MTEKTKEFKNTLFDVRRSIRYHMRRCRFFDLIHDLITGFTVLLGTSAVYTVLSASIPKNYAALIAAFVSALGVFDLVIGTSRKSRLHSNLANKFQDLEKDMLSDKDDEQKLYLQKRLEIEKDEPPVLRVLDVICYNEQLRADGYPVKSYIKIGWFQRIFSSFFDLNEYRLNQPNNLEKIKTNNFNWIDAIFYFILLGAFILLFFCIT